MVAQRLSGPGGRWYVRPATGVLYPSVTTILDMIAKPFLIPWAAKQTAEFVADNMESLGALGWDERVKTIKGRWNEVRMEAADRGTAAHEYADSYLTFGLADPPTTHTHESILEAIDVLAPSDTLTEATVISEVPGAMGTLDGLWIVQGERWLIDWKTGNRVWSSHGMQVVAYGRADLILDHDDVEHPMPPIDRHVIIHTPMEGPWAMYEVTPTEEDWEAFCAAHAIFMWEHGRGKTVLGPPHTAVTLLGIEHVGNLMLRGNG